MGMRQRFGVTGRNLVGQGSNVKGQRSGQKAQLKSKVNGQGAAVRNPTVLLRTYGPAPLRPVRSLKSAPNRIACGAGSERSADVPRGFASLHRGFDGSLDAVRLVEFAEIVEHHRGREDRSDWIGDVFPCERRGRSV